MNIANTVARVRALIDGDYSPSIQRRYSARELFIAAPTLIGTLEPATVNQAAIRLYNAANKNFVLTGTNAADSCSVPAAEGGVTLTTTTATGDSLVLFPYVPTSGNAAGPFSVDFSPQRAAALVARIRTGAALPSAGVVTSSTNGFISLGFKLTNANDALQGSPTDADHCAVVFDPNSSVSSTNWLLHSRVNGTNTVRDTGVTVAVNTSYTFELRIGADRVPRLAINSPFYVKAARAAGPALTAAAAFRPFFALRNGTNAGIVTSIRYLEAMRDYNA